MIRSSLLVLWLLLATLSAQAALLGRLPLNPSSWEGDVGNYQAWYDTRLGITWLDDTNLAYSSGYSTDFDGRMNWLDAQDFIATMNADGYLGINTWRLPSASPVNEMADLWAGTLGGTCDPVGVCVLPGYGPFDDFPAGDYWTGTLQFGGSWAEDFYFPTGYAGNGNVVTGRKVAWLVTDGDVAAVPIPAVGWLIGPALGLMAWRQRPS